MKKFLAILLSLVLCVSLAACGGSTNTGNQGNGTTAPASTAASTGTAAAPEKVYEINAGISIASGTPRDGSWEVSYCLTFKDYVEKNSNGAIKFNLFYGNSLGSDKDVISGVSNGTIEFFGGDISMVSSYYKPALLFTIPGAFLNNDQANALFDSEWMSKFYDDCAAKTGIKILGTTAKGFRNFTTVKKELKTVDDIKGLTIRVKDNPISIKMMESLGANPVPMDISELYTALQNGVVDGHENSIVNILQDKTYEVEKYLVLDGHYGSYSSACMSNAFFESLPDDLKKVVLDANKVAIEEVKKTVEKMNSTGLEKLKENGVSIYQPTEEELKAWHEPYQEACLELAKKEIGEDTVNDFIAAIQKYGSAK